MPYVPFYELFPEIAERETRSFTVVDGGELPAGTYGLIDMYCDESGCDCRSVFSSVLLQETERIEAVTAYGRESLEFYSEWMGAGHPDMIKDLKGPVLNMASRQSKLAPAILKTVEDVVLKDKRYVERLKRHYKMFREVIDGKGRAKGNRGQKKSVRSRRILSRKRRRERRRQEHKKQVRLSLRFLLDTELTLRYISSR